MKYYHLTLLSLGTGQKLLLNWISSIFVDHYVLTDWHFHASFFLITLFFTSALYFREIFRYFCSKPVYDSLVLYLSWSYVYRKPSHKNILYFGDSAEFTIRGILVVDMSSARDMKFFQCATLAIIWVFGWKGMHVPLMTKVQCEDY